MMSAKSGPCSKKLLGALEAQVREDQPWDLKYSQLLNTFDEHKIRTPISLWVMCVKEKQETVKKQKALDTLKRKLVLRWIISLDTMYEKLATEREKADKKQEDNISLGRI